MLIYILIVLLVILTLYQVYLAFTKETLVEALESQKKTDEYQPYNTSDPNNCLILAQQNSGNIEVLKGRLDKYDGVDDKLVKMQQDMNSMQTQIDSLVQQQADYAQEIAGSEPVTVTGTEEEE